MKSILLALCLCFAAVLFTNGQTIRPFRQGDRVVFMGNSITDGGHYHSYIWLYYQTRFPDLKLQIFNAGIGGDIAQQMYERLDSDVFRHKPTVVTLTFGMNDTGYQNLKGAEAESVYKQKVDISLASFKLIENKLKQHPGVEKIMIASSPYDETSKLKNVVFEGKNAAILKIAEEQKRAATDNKWMFLDFNTPMVKIARYQQQRDSLFSFQNGDRVHPANDGQMVMAYLFLKAQGLANKNVAKVIINPSAKTAELAENCTITNLIITPTSVNFNYLAKSLPYPMDTIPTGWGNPKKSQYDALKVIPFIDEFNKEIIQIRGLRGDKYVLKIDNNIISTYTGNELNGGVNLASVVVTPQYQQAAAVMHLNEERWEIERRLREYYWTHYSILKPKGLLFNDSNATLDSLQQYARKDFFVAATLPTYRKARFQNIRIAWQKEIDLLTDEIYIINKPQVHKIEVVEVK
jgi:lysophospholipase L1-like esterase